MKPIMLNLRKLRSTSCAGIALFSLLGLGTCSPAGAVNLGVQGTVWPIIEIDMRTLIMQQVAQANWKGVQKQLKTSAQNYFHDLPKRTVTETNSTVTTWYDPSFTLKNDIWAPQKNAAGNYKWVILYHKGKKVNPLAYERPTNAMLFFNGRSKAQVAFVTKAIEKFPTKLMLVEATGMDPQPIALKVHAPVYTETPEMTQRFDLSRTPSLLYPGSGVHRMYLGYTTYAAPFSIKALQETWPSGFGVVVKEPVK